MLNFFAILLIIFIVFLLLIFKKKQFKNAINLKNLSSNKIINNKKYISKKNGFSYKQENIRYSEFEKKALRNTMFKLFQSHKDDKLKALKIAEKLADQSILPILRRGLKDIYPEVIERSAFLIRKFK
ncbi:annexin [Prochlorococcus marinus]|uniref:annexin n=1 Tax=Prochlorococcus marinus TaxID=1219 RepID=UPI001ADA5717|nr:annexin [Prochlorococcus marinus]MBO8205250.1 annexin [Prochlorococcus marinus CUG1415]MBW3044511.1 annexin [Prochlorococcus marinus str. MU1415]